MDTKVQIEPTKDTIYHLHQQLLKHGIGQAANSNELLYAMGGIDAVLSHYLLADDPSNLSQLQLCRIHEIITRTSSNNQQPHIAHAFRADETFLHYWFDDETTQRINNIIYSKFVIGLVIIILVPYMIWDANSGYAQYPNSLVRVILFSCSWLLGTIWIVAIFLTLNVMVIISI